jgi:hypothetical protein
MTIVSCMKKIFVFVLSTVFLFSSRLYAQGDGLQHNYGKADSIAALYPRHSLNDLASLAHKLTRSLSTDEEKFRAIYKWVCNNIENDYTLYQINKKKREKVTDPEELKNWNKEFSIKVYKTLREKYKTVCTGYAYLVEQLSSFAGLNCKIIDGYGRTVEANIGGRGIANHSWSAVQLSGKWYLCDPTWSSGSYNHILGRFVKKFEESYFLADPKMFIRNHYPTDTSWTMLKNMPTLHQFLNAPIIYVGAFHAEVLPLFPETLEVSATKGDTVSFRFRTASTQPIGNLDLQIVRAGQHTSVTPQITHDYADIYSIEHIFKSSGRYIVHVRSNSSYLFTYNITVD